MAKIRLIHWQAREAQERARRLRQAGHQVAAGPLDSAGLTALRRRPPDAVVIDLDRQPAQGQDVGAALRSSRATRGIPLVFVGGAPEKVEPIRRLLPDAVYTTWEDLAPDLRRAIAEPPSRPVATASAMAGYAGVPLAKKLGIKPGSRVALVAAPEGFEATVGELPEGAELRRGLRGRRDLTVWFPRSRRDLEGRIGGMARQAAEAPLWIAWPRQAAGRASDLTQAAVRKAGLAAGLVDYKICAIDRTFSGLLFTRRRGG